MAKAKPRAAVLPTQVPLPRCIDCTSTDAAHITFLGDFVCDRCLGRRERMAVLLFLIIAKSATPEQVHAFVSLSAEPPPCDPAEREEMVDHVDLLLREARS